jgi:hypothetical protein
MCSSNRSEPDLVARLRHLDRWTWQNRAVVVPVALAGLAAAAIALIAYFFGPTDIERAEADLRKAQAVVNAIEAEAPRQLKDWREHSQEAVHYRKIADENKNSSDVESLEWHLATARGHARLAGAASDRRDHLLRLAAEYRRLVAEAQCEILQAKEARERGMPYEVAPRVRELLKPILTNH